MLAVGERAHTIEVQYDGRTWNLKAPFQSSSGDGSSDGSSIQVPACHCMC